MSGFLYYVPGHITLDHDIVEQVGLGEILGDMRFETNQAASGPDGKGGVVATTHLGDGRAQVKPMYVSGDRQKWKDCGGYWFGLDCAYDRPTPADLARETLQSGMDMELSNGETWKCPVARALPSFWGFDEETGDRARKLRPEYEALSRDGETALGHFDREAWESGGKAPWFDPEWAESLEATEICVRALAVNYRIGAREAAALALPTCGDVMTILAALLDLPGTVGAAWLEEKKTDGCDSSG